MSGADRGRLCSSARSSSCPGVCSADEVCGLRPRDESTTRPARKPGRHGDSARLGLIMCYFGSGGRQEKQLAGQGSSAMIHACGYCDMFCALLPTRAIMFNHRTHCYSGEHLVDAAPAAVHRAQWHSCVSCRAEAVVSFGVAGEIGRDTKQRI